MKIKPETRTVFVGTEDLPVEMTAKRGWVSVFLGVRRLKHGTIVGAVPDSVRHLVDEAEEEEAERCLDDSEIAGTP